MCMSVTPTGTSARTRSSWPWRWLAWSAAGRIGFLTREEVDALRRAPDLRILSGRRDHALMVVAVQTGLRLSEITGLWRRAVCLGTGAHVRVLGKVRKERSTPLTRTPSDVL